MTSFSKYLCKTFFICFLCEVLLLSQIHFAYATSPQTTVQIQDTSIISPGDGPQTVASNSDGGLETTGNIISMLTATAFAFFAGYVGKQCLPQAKKVPSVILYLSASAILIAEEIAAAVGYKKAATEAMTISQEKGGENEQLVSFCDHYKQLETSKTWALAKSILLGTAATAFGGAAAASLAEWHHLLPMLTQVKAFTQKLKVLIAANNALAASGLAILNSPASNIAKISYSRLLDILRNHFILFQKIGIPSSTRIGNFVTEGTPTTPTETETNHQAILASSTILIGLNQTTEQATLAAITAAKASSIGGLAPLLAHEIPILEAILANLQIIKVLVGESPAISSALTQSRWWSLTTCLGPPTVAKNSNQQQNLSPYQKVFDLLSPKLMAQNPIEKFLAPMLIVGAVLAGVFLTMVKKIAPKINAFLYHPRTRAALFTTGAAAISVAAGISGSVYSKLKNREKKVEGLIQELYQRVIGESFGSREAASQTPESGYNSSAKEICKDVSDGNLPDPYDPSANDIGPNTTTSGGSGINATAYPPSDYPPSGSGSCVAENFEGDPSCNCKATNTCFTPSPIPDSPIGGGGFIGKMPTAGFANGLNKIRENLATGNLAGALDGGQGINANANAINDQIKKLEEEIDKSDPGNKSWDGLKESNNDFLKDLQSTGFNYAKKHGGNLGSEGTGSLGGLGGGIPDLGDGINAIADDTKDGKSNTDKNQSVIGHASAPTKDFKFNWGGGSTRSPSSETPNFNGKNHNKKDFASKIRKTNLVNADKGLNLFDLIHLEHVKTGLPRAVGK